MKTKFSIIAILIGLITGCENKKTTKESPDKVTISEVEVVASGKKSDRLTWKDHLNLDKVIQSGGEIALQNKDKYNKVLQDLDVDSLKSQAKNLGDAIRTEDFSKAETLANELGKSLESSSIGATVRILRIKSEFGVSAAEDEIRKHLESVDLSPEEIQFFKDLQSGLASLKKEEMISIVVFITMIACEAKFGHGGSAIAAVLHAVLAKAFLGEDILLENIYSEVLPHEAKETSP